MRTERSSPKRRTGRLFTATMLCLGLVAAGCGDDDDGASSVVPGTTEPATADTDAATTEPAPADDTSNDTTDDSVATSDTAAAGPVTTGAATTAAPGPTTPPASTTPPVTAAPEEKPVAGGSLVMGIEADTSSPWVPYEALCAISCHQIMRSIFDSLTMPNTAGAWVPYLAESVIPNTDFTAWRITARAGVTFHDGTAFDGAAIVDNLTRAKTGSLTGNVLRSVETIETDPVDPMTAVLTMSSPWAAFPYALMGQAGYMASPEWLAATDSDATVKTQPVGTGPFVYVDYRPNELFSMKRNPTYWNQPYPYLDAVEFRPIPDALNRRDALKSGTIDLMHTTNGETIAEFRGSGEFPMVEITNFGETAYTMLHVSQEDSPLSDRRVRCALALATDSQALIDVVGAGVGRIATGPFSPTQVGHLADSGFPLAQDMPAAQALIADYKADNPGPLTLSLATTQDQTNLTTAQFQQQWFEEAGIDEVTLDQIDQGSYIFAAVFGNFQTFQWRLHGGFDLDMQYHWWHSSTALPVDALALNFGRIKDPNLDALLEENRASSDPVRKKAIAEEVNRLFATECYNLWGSYSTWAVPTQADVHGPTSFALPDGSMAEFGAGIGGNFSLMNMWVDQ